MANFNVEVKPRLVEPPLNFDDSLAKRKLTYFAKQVIQSDPPILFILFQRRSIYDKQINPTLLMIPNRLGDNHNLAVGNGTPNRDCLPYCLTLTTVCPSTRKRLACHALSHRGNRCMRWSVCVWITSESWWRHKIEAFYWPFVTGIHRSSVDSPHKGQ